MSSKRVIVAIRCSIRLEVPLGDRDKIMVSKEYLWYLVEIANEKMEANRKRCDSFHDALLKNELFMQADIGDGSGECELMELNQDLGDMQLTREITDDTSNGMIVFRIDIFVYLANEMYLFVMTYLSVRKFEY